MKTEKDIVNEILFELEKAKKKHPEFPFGVVEMLAIMAEESGEAVQAGNNYKWENGDISAVEIELKHTAAMCIRILERIDEMYSHYDAKKREKNRKLT